jgi:hypothetical protein
MDAVVHERMLVRHITRCSSRSTSRTTTTPPWTDSSQTHPRVETRTTTKRTRTNTDIHRLTHEEPNASVTNSTTTICHEEESRDNNQSIPITPGHSSYLRQDIMVTSATTAWSSSEEHPILNQSLRKRTAYDGNCSPQSVVVHLSKIQSLDTATASTRKLVDLGIRSDALHTKPPEASIASRVQRKIAAAAKKSEPQTHPALQQHPSATPVPPPTQQPWGFSHVAQPPSIDTALSPVHQPQPPPRSPPSPLPACDSSHRRHATNDTTTTTTTTTIPVPSSSHSSRMPASAAAVHCPMCARSFPRTVRAFHSPLCAYIHVYSIAWQRFLTTDWSSVLLHGPRLRATHPRSCFDMLQQASNSNETTHQAIFVQGTETNGIRSGGLNDFRFNILYYRRIDDDTNGYHPSYQDEEARYFGSTAFPTSNLVERTQTNQTNVAFGGL